MNLLDVRTVLFSQLITDTICTVVLAYLWWLNRKRYAGISFWVIDFIFQTLAALLVVLRGSIPDWVSVGLASGLVIGGAYAGYLGLERFLGKKGSPVFNSALLAAFILIHLYFALIHPNLDGRNLNLSLGLLVFCGQCAWLMLRRAGRAMARMGNVVGWVFVAFCLASLARIFFIIAIPNSSNDFFQSDLYDTLILMSFQILLILLCFSLFLMVTQQLTLEAKTQEDKFYKIFRLSPYAVTITRLLDGLILDVNRGFEETTGYPSSEVIGRTTFDLGIWANEADRQQIAAELAATGEVRGKEFQFKGKSGREVTGLFYAEVLEIENEKIILGSTIDISEHKKIEDLLRQSEERYKLIFESAPLAINITHEAVITYANPSYLKLFGYASLDELKSLAPVELFAPEYRPKILENIQRRAQGLPVPDSYEVECFRKDGTRVPILMFLTRTIFADGPATVGFVLDITERKRAEASLARQTAELERLYRASESLLFSSTYNLESLAKTIVEVVLRVFGQDNCSVFLVSKDSNRINRVAVAGPYADQVKKAALISDGPGQVPQAIRSGQVINTVDVQASSVYVPSWEDARAELTIPLKVGDQVIGALDVQSAELGAFTAEDERLMLVFAERAALALERGQLNEELEHQVQQLTSLRTIDMAISSSVDIKLILGILLDQLIKQLGVDAADALLFDPHLQMFNITAAQGFHNLRDLNTHLRLDDGGASRALRERRIVFIRDLHDAPSEAGRQAAFSREGFVSFVGVPLIAKGQVKGVLEVFQRSPFDLNPQQRAFLEILAGQAAIAIDNTQLFENLQGSNEELMMAYDETIEGWSRAMDLRDKETEGHTRRVTEMTQQLAGSMGFGPEELVHIRRGALLHDIGKIGVPDEILRKPGSLTDEEWLIMRRHPQLAYDMLSPIIYLQPAMNIPYCHHERWDGEGYPRRLKGDQIPLVARIFAVIDVWDALTSPRPYREALSETQARQYIEEQSGQHFDPVVVKNFLAMKF